MSTRAKRIVFLICLAVLIVVLVVELINLPSALGQEFVFILRVFPGR